MSKYALIKTIQKEIQAINWKIDMKIIRGISYRQEARRHKFLLSQLQYLSRVSEFSPRPSFFQKMSSVMTSFVL